MFTMRIAMRTKTSAENAERIQEGDENYDEH